MTHICVSKLTITGPDNGLLPIRRLAIIWSNAGILLFGPIEKKPQWNYNRNSKIFTQENVFESVVCEMAAILSRPQCVNKQMSMPGAPQMWCWSVPIFTLFYKSMPWRNHTISPGYKTYRNVVMTLISLSLFMLRHSKSWSASTVPMVVLFQIYMSPSDAPLLLVMVLGLVTTGSKSNGEIWEKNQDFFVRTFGALDIAENKANIPARAFINVTNVTVSPFYFHWSVWA